MVEVVFHTAHERYVLLVNRHHPAGVAGLVLLDTDINVAFGQTDLEVAVDFPAQKILLAQQVNPALLHRHGR